MDIQNMTWIGKQVGKYKILKLLGCGGMGSVYQATHLILGNTVCLKMLLPDLIRQGERAIARFLHEAYTIAKLEHPNIVKIYDIDEQDGTYFIVMEYIQGKTLAHIFEDREAFTVRETLRLGIEIAEALSIAHQENIIHRDIKPANIMITTNNHVKLTDFGLAYMTDSSDNFYPGQIVGSPLYLSPEAIENRPMDMRMDLYSFGITLYQMLSGSPPYAADNLRDLFKMHLFAPIPSIRSIRSDIPPELDAIICKLMAKEPQARFSSATETKAVLQQCEAILQKTSIDQTIDFPIQAVREMIVPAAQVDHEPVDKADAEEKIRVLVVEDSRTMRQAISRIIKQENGLHLAGVAHNGIDALNLIPRLNPHVITLDFNMPEMGGITAIKQIISRYPRPVIMLSGFTHESAWTTFECLACGAVDFIWKGFRGQIKQFDRELVKKIYSAARIKLTVPAKPRIAKSLETAKHAAHFTTTPAQVVVVAVAGEGSCQASLKLVPYIPKNIPCAIIFVQQMQEELSDSFCRYLDYYSRIHVKQIEPHEILCNGVCYITRNNAPLRLEKTVDGFRIAVSADDDNIDVERKLMESLAKECGPLALGIALSGAPKEILSGLRKIKNRGGKILVQSADTCLHPEIAYLAVKEAIVEHTVSDIDIASVLWHLVKNNAPQKSMMQTTRKVQSMMQIAKRANFRPRRLYALDRIEKNKQKSILLLEDDDLSKEMMQHYLKEEGYQVTAVGDGEEAILIVERQTFNLIISDINMPRLNGMKFLDIIRHNGIQTPLIFVTARDESSDELLALKMGASDYIRKPIHKEIMLIRVQNCLKRAIK